MCLKIKFYRCKPAWNALSLLRLEQGFLWCCRQSEGSSPEGYTLQEACILTRSSLTKQRVLALHLLSAVLSRARPQARHHDPKGFLQQQLIDLPPLLTRAETIQVSFRLCFTETGNKTGGRGGEGEGWEAN